MNEINREEQEDATVDALSVTAIIAIVVAGVAFWLGSMPS